MATGTPRQKERVRQEIAQFLEQQPENLAALSYLFYNADRSDKKHLVETMYSLIKNKKAFKEFLDRLYSDEEDGMPTLASLISGTVNNSVLQKAPVGEQGIHLQNQTPVTALIAFHMLPASNKYQVYNGIAAVVNWIFNTKLVVVANATALAESNKATARLIISTIMLTLGWSIHKEIESLNYNRIGGKRCAKNIIVHIAATAGAVGGGYIGAAIGNLIYPGVGTVAGAVFGSLFAGFTACLPAKKKTEKIFTVPATKGGSFGKCESVSV